jgi:peptidoglycan/xylan/chitin deacetylase (PgdA/CDA1 family)
MNKYYLEQAARLLAKPLYASGLHLLTRPFYSGLGQILMLHRVVPQTRKLRIHNHKSLEISPEHLESIIQYFIRNKYDFISLDSLLQQPMEHNGKRKFVVFTFDDGYFDNLEYAFPIFNKYQVPFTIYVATCMPDRTAILWWYLLEDLVVRQNTIKLDTGNQVIQFRSDTVKRKELSFNQLRTFFAHADQARQQFLVDSLFPESEQVVSSINRELALRWDQIAQLSNDKLVTIGSHTVNHFPLAALSASDSKFEIEESGKRIAHHIGAPVKHFCYPLGSYADKEIKLLKESTYQTATTIKMANIFTENFNQPFALPRIMVNALTDEKILHLQVNGLLPAMRNRFRRIVY